MLGWISIAYGVFITDWAQTKLGMEGCTVQQVLCVMSEKAVERDVLESGWRP